MNLKTAQCLLQFAGRKEDLVFLFTFAIPPYAWGGFKIEISQVCEPYAMYGKSSPHILPRFHPIVIQVDEANLYHLVVRFPPTYVDENLTIDLWASDDPSSPPSTPISLKKDKDGFVTAIFPTRLLHGCPEALIIVHRPQRS